MRRIVISPPTSTRPVATYHLSSLPPYDSRLTQTFQVDIAWHPPTCSLIPHTQTSSDTAKLMYGTPMLCNVDSLNSNLNVFPLPRLCTRSLPCHVYYRSISIYSYHLHQANSTEPHVRLIPIDSFPMPLLFSCSIYCMHASNKALNASKCNQSNRLPMLWMALSQDPAVGGRHSDGSVTRGQFSA